MKLSEQFKEPQDDVLEIALPDSTRRVNEYTFHSKESLWFNNLGQNAPFIRESPDIKELPKGNGLPVIVIGAGPTIKKYKQLQMIAKSGFKGHIIVCDKILKSVLGRRIIPNYVVSLDGDPMIADFFPKHKKNDITKAIFNGLSIHPDTIAACKFPISFFISILDNPHDFASLTRAIHHMTQKTMIASMGNVGGTSWHLAYYLEYNPIALIGIDYGYPKTTHIEDTIWYKAYLKLVKGNKELVKEFFALIENTETKTDLLIDMNFNAYRNGIMPFIKRAKCKTINCSPESSLFGKGIKYQDLEEFLNEHS